MRPIVLILTLLCFCAHAGPLKKIPCAKNVYHTLGGWEEPVDWRALGNSAAPITEMVSPTDKTGVWLRLATGKKWSQVVRETPQSSVHFLFKEPKCEPQLQVVKTEARAAPKDAFTDSDLDRLLADSKKSGRSGMIYVWSPRMNLSVLGTKEAAELAKKMNLDFVLLRDPLQAREPAAAGKDKVMGSHELKRRGLLIHFPALVLYSNGMLHEKIRPGYDEPPGLEVYVKESLKR